MGKDIKMSYHEWICSSIREQNRRTVLANTKLFLLLSMFESKCFGDFRSRETPGSRQKLHWLFWCLRLRNRWEKLFSSENSIFQLFLHIIWSKQRRRRSIFPIWIKPTFHFLLKMNLPMKNEVFLNMKRWRGITREYLLSWWNKSYVLNKTMWPKQRTSSEFQN